MRQRSLGEPPLFAESTESHSHSRLIQCVLCSQSSQYQVGSTQNSAILGVFIAFFIVHTLKIVMNLSDWTQVSALVVNLEAPAQRRPSSGPHYGYPHLSVDLCSRGERSTPYSALDRGVHQGRALAQRERSASAPFTERPKGGSGSGNLTRVADHHSSHTITDTSVTRRNHQ